MGAEMGELQGHAKGTVVKGEDIEMVLAQVPEQTWTYEDEVMVGDDMRGFEPRSVTCTVTMRARREIIANVLIALGMTR